MYGVWHGKDMGPHFRVCWRLCHNHGEGLSYADPLVIREGPTCHVELAISSDGNFVHNTSATKLLVGDTLNAMSRMACKMSRPVINTNFILLYL